MVTQNGRRNSSQTVFFLHTQCLFGRHASVDAIRRFCSSSLCLPPPLAAVFNGGLNFVSPGQSTGASVTTAAAAAEALPDNFTCGRINIMGTIVRDASPYLFPLMIEYSLIGAALLYIMWQNIGRCPRYLDEDDIPDHVSVTSRKAHTKVRRCQSGETSLQRSETELTMS